MLIFQLLIKANLGGVVWIILFLLCEYYFNIVELAAYIFLQNVLIIMHNHGFIRFGKGEVRWVVYQLTRSKRQKVKRIRVLDSTLSE